MVKNDKDMVRYSMYTSKDYVWCLLGPYHFLFHRILYFHLLDHLIDDLGQLQELSTKIVQIYVFAMEYLLVSVWHFCASVQTTPLADFGKVGNRND